MNSFGRGLRIRPFIVTIPTGTLLKAGSTDKIFRSERFPENLSTDSGKTESRRPCATKLSRACVCSMLTAAAGGESLQAWKVANINESTVVSEFGRVHGSSTRSASLILFFPAHGFRVPATTTYGSSKSGL